MLYTHMLKTLLFSKGSASPEPGSTSLLRQAAARSSAAQAFAPFILGGGGFGVAEVLYRVHGRAE